MAGAIIDQLEGARGMSGWRWLLLIEGVFTVFCGFALYFLLPNYPRNSKMLTPEQRLLGHVRIMRDRNERVESQDDQMTPWQACVAVLKDGRTWFYLILYCCNVLALTLTYFLPVILRGMGYTKVTAQWMTVPVWTSGAIFQLVWSWTSDKTQDRRWHNSALLGLAGVAALVSAIVTTDIVKYVMFCFMWGGMYTTVPLILNWTSEALARPERKRSIAIAFVNSFGHTTFIYGSFLWPSSEGPRNLTGFAVVTAFLFLGAALAAVMPIIFKWIPNNDPEDHVIEPVRDTVSLDAEKAEMKEKMEKA